MSLNSQLLHGPDPTSALTRVLARFRKEPAVIAADAEATFHQVKGPNGGCDLPVNTTMINFCVDDCLQQLQRKVQLLFIISFHSPNG